MVSSQIECTRGWKLFRELLYTVKVVPLDLIGWKIYVLFFLNQISKAVKSASSVKTASTGFALVRHGAGEVGGALKRSGRQENCAAVALNSEQCVGGLVPGWDCWQRGLGHKSDQYQL